MLTHLTKKQDFSLSFERCGQRSCRKKHLVHKKSLKKTDQRPKVSAAAALQDLHAGHHGRFSLIYLLKDQRWSVLHKRDVDSVCVTLDL